MLARYAFRDTCALLGKGVPAAGTIRYLHVDTANCSRIKWRHTHKPFFHVKKTNKHPDTPITWQNKQFIEEVMHDVYHVGQVAQLVHRHELDDNDSPLKSSLQPWPKGNWEQYGFRTTRAGLIGRKIGSVPMWYKDGTPCYASMVHIEDNHVVKYITPEEFSKTIVAERRSRTSMNARPTSIRYGSLVVGALSADPSKFTKDYCGLFTESGLMPKKKLCRFPVTDNAIIKPGTPLLAGHFEVGQYVDLVGTSARKGFQGVMKRWGFSGMPSDKHGVTKSHRRPGCIGSGRDKSRVWPGQKLPGHMGGDVVKQPGRKVIRINHRLNVLYILGPTVPGEIGEFVKVFDCKMKAKCLTRSPRFFPTCYPEDYDQLPDEELDEAMFRLDSPTIHFD